MSSNTVYIGNLDEKVEQRMLYEVMVQAGPLAGVSIPRNKNSKQPQGFGFAEYTTKESAIYAIKLFSGLVNLFGKPLHFNFAAVRKSPRVKKTSSLQRLSTSYQVPVNIIQSTPEGCTGKFSTQQVGYFGYLPPPGNLSNTSPISGSAVVADDSHPPARKLKRKRFVSDAIEIRLTS